MTTASWSPLVGLPSQVVNGPNFGSAAVTAGSITLATTGGTAAALNYYEEYTDSNFAIASNGTSYSAASVTVTIKVVRVGKIVVLHIPPFQFTGNGVAGGSLFVSTSAIPSRFCPVPGVNDTILYLAVNNAGVAQGSIAINRSGTTGILAFGTGLAVGGFGFANGSTYGLANDTYISWNL